MQWYSVVNKARCSPMPFFPVFVRGASNPPRVKLDPIGLGLKCAFAFMRPCGLLQISPSVRSQRAKKGLFLTDYIQRRADFAILSRTAAALVVANAAMAFRTASISAGPNSASPVSAKGQAHPRNACQFRNANLTGASRLPSFA